MFVYAYYVFVRACEAHQHILTGGWNGTIWSWWAWHVFKPWFNHHNISQQALKHYTCGTTTFRHATTQGVAYDPKQSRDYAEIPSVSSKKEQILGESGGKVVASALGWE